MLEKLRKQVLEANLELVNRGLVLYTFGNASAISREDGMVVIKPSGVPYAEMRPEHMVITDLDGSVVEGELRPSSDLRTHLVLYREFRALGGSYTPTLITLLSGRKHAVIFHASALRIPTISMDRFRLRLTWILPRSKKTMNGTRER